MKIRVFRHYLDAPTWILALLEGAVFFGSVYAAAHLRYLGGTAENLNELGPLYGRAIVIAATMLTIFLVLGLYNAEFRWGERNSYFLHLVSFIFGFAALTVIFYVVPHLFLGRGVLGISLVIAFAGVTAIRILFFVVLGGGAGRRRVIVLGTGSRPAKIAELAKSENNHNRFALVGFVQADDHEIKVDPDQLVPNNAPLLALARQNRADEVVVGIRQRRGGTLNMKDLLECRMEGIHVVDLSTFFERETGKVQLESLNPSWMVFSDGFNRSNIRTTVKRAFDITVSGSLLLLTFPVFLLTALAVRLTSSGPVFYRQTRVGECGQNFDILKFRSMRVDAEKEGAPQWASQKDSRVTPIGRFIRKVRIDELPQVFNVLKGDMSFVGPRPERPFFVNQLISKIPYYSARHAVKPGITGWAQICYPYGSSIEDAKEKLQYDLYYVKNHTLFLDLIIMFQTAQVVLFGRGAR